MRITYSMQEWADQNLDRTVPGHATKQLKVGFDLGQKAVYEVFKDTCARGAQ